MLSGLALLFHPAQFFYLIVGLVAGFVIGVLPGFQSSNGAAIALPFAIVLPVEQALLLLIGIYCGATFSGAVPAILVNVPGTAGAAATALDGYPLTQQGKSEMAIGLARTASSLGGVVSFLVIIAIMRPMTEVALLFGAREMFLVVVIGLLLIAGLVGDNPMKGLVSASMGLMLGAMGASPVTGQARMTFGFPELHDGIPLIPALIGLFAYAQMFVLASQESLIKNEALQQRPRAGVPRQLFNAAELLEGVTTTLRYPRTILRSSVIGLLIGILPGGGASIANFVAYAAARRASKASDSFGHGNPEGVVASEAADNAVSGGTLVPTLTLGVPGSATAAIMLAAIMLAGIPPGPRALVLFPAEIYAVLWGGLFASILILPIGILLAAPMTLITRVPPRMLVPAILFIASVGVFAYRNQVFDVGLALIFGIVGFFMIRHRYPPVPMVLGLILGPLAEMYFMRGLNLGNYRVGYFFGSPLVLVLWAILILAVGIAVFRNLRRPVERDAGPKKA